MRQIGTLPDRAAAEQLQDFLIAQRMPCSLDESDAGYGLWIHDDDHLDAAKTVLEHFRQHPEDDRYRNARTQADALLREKAAARKAARKNTVRMSQRWDSGGSGALPLTLGMMLICLFVFVETNLRGDESGFQELLMFSRDGSWKAIVQDGEWWRLVSPSILHFGIFHVAFNLIGWYQLAGTIELRKGTTYLFALMISTALATDILQFLSGGWRFGGMSGIVYGLFAYVWVKGKLDPGDGFGIHPTVATNYLLFYVLCWFNVFGRVANFGHFGGLLMGVIFATVSAMVRNRRR